jgi:hypothetical protein
MTRTAAVFECKYNEETEETTTRQYRSQTKAVLVETDLIDFNDEPGR